MAKKKNGVAGKQAVILSPSFLWSEAHMRASVIDKRVIFCARVIHILLDSFLLLYECFLLGVNFFLLVDEPLDFILHLFLENFFAHLDSDHLHLQLLLLNSLLLECQFFLLQMRNLLFGVLLHFLQGSLLLP